ncbi:MAG TPA: hypothetical protein VGN97_00935 [Mesorhizobium sp.]|jgi:hypothetical protein|nr:hypothetical protein [Mesorhizobium sp.]
MVDVKRDFASLLDDLFAAADERNTAPPITGVDYLSVVDELHSGRIRVSPEPALASYREAAAMLEEELAGLFALEDAAAEALPPTDPPAIATELGLERLGPAELAQVRRQFALKNHPDLVAPHLRENALQRMQVANMLIDEAERKAGRGRA